MPPGVGSVLVKAQLSINLPPAEDWSKPQPIEADDLESMIELAIRRAQFSLVFAIAQHCNTLNQEPAQVYASMFSHYEEKIKISLDTDDGIELIELPVTWDDCNKWCSTVLEEFVDNGGKIPTLGL